MTTANDKEQTIPETNDPLYPVPDEEIVDQAAEETAIPLGGECLEEDAVPVDEEAEAPVNEETPVAKEDEKADKKKDKKKKDKKKPSKKEKKAKKKEKKKAEKKAKKEKKEKKKDKKDKKKDKKKK